MLASTGVYVYAGVWVWVVTLRNEEEVYFLGLLLEVVLQEMAAAVVW